MNVNAILNYEVLPNSQLIQNLKVDYSCNDPMSDLDAVKSILAQLSRRGFSGVYTRGEYEGLVSNFDVSFAERRLHYGHASLFSMLSAAFKFLKPYLIHAGKGLLTDVATGAAQHVIERYGTSNLDGYGHAGLGDRRPIRIICPKPYIPSPQPGYGASMLRGFNLVRKAESVANISPSIESHPLANISPTDVEYDGSKLGTFPTRETVRFFPVVADGGSKAYSARLILTDREYQPKGEIVKTDSPGITLYSPAYDPDELSRMTRFIEQYRELTTGQDRMS